MKILATVQNKGGVGKTTLTRLLAEYAARSGLRVLGIDLDPQCNFSRRFLDMELDPLDPDGVLPPVHEDFDPVHDAPWNGRSSSADIYYAGETIPYSSKLTGLDILPGHGDRLRAIELVDADSVKARVHDRLYEFLSLPEVPESYDLVLLDTSPSKGPLTVSAVRAATHLVIPTIMEPQCVEGLYGMMQLWRRETRIRPKSRPLQLLGIIPNLFRQNAALHAGTLGSLLSDTSIAAYLSECRLGQRVAFAESDHPHAEPRSVFDLSKRDPARKEAESLCGMLLDRMEMEAAA